jgi:transcription elongation factor GreB
VARALLGTQVGDLVKLRTPQGTESIEIVAIHYPER